MKLKEWISKVKQSNLRIIDFQNYDPDRIGDLILAAALAVAVTSLTLAYYFGAGLGFQPTHMTVFNI